MHVLSVVCVSACVASAGCTCGATICLNLSPFRVRGRLKFSREPAGRRPGTGHRAPGTRAPGTAHPGTRAPAGPRPRHAPRHATPFRPPTPTLGGIIAALALPRSFASPARTHGTHDTNRNRNRFPGCSHPPTSNRYNIDTLSILYRYSIDISPRVYQGSACSFSATPIEDPGPQNIEAMSIQYRHDVDIISILHRHHVDIASTSHFDIDIAAWYVDIASTLHRYQNLISMVVRPHSSACSFSATPIEDPGPPNIEAMSIQYRHDFDIISILHRHHFLISILRRGYVDIASIWLRHCIDIKI